MPRRTHAQAKTVLRTESNIQTCYHFSTLCPSHGFNYLILFYNLFYLYNYIMVINKLVQKENVTFYGHLSKLFSDHC